MNLSYIVQVSKKNMFKQFVHAHQECTELPSMGHMNLMEKMS